MLSRSFAQREASSSTRRRFNSEVTNGVEDPIERHTEVALAALTSALQAFEQRRKFAAAPVNHSDGNVHLRMQNVLRVQLPHHAIGDELIIVGCAQPLGDGFEGQQESGEVFVLVQRASFFFGEDASAVGDVGIAIVRRGKRRGMAAAQLGQRCRIDGAFEMQMQLGLGEGKDIGAGRGSAVGQVVGSICRG